MNALGGRRRRLKWTQVGVPRSDVVDRYRNGMKPAEIASDLGVDPSTVYRRLREAAEAGEIEPIEESA